MSILEKVLMEEYDCSLCISRAIEAENASLPRGSVRKRMINGRPYFYLRYRDGTRVRSEYLKADEAKAVAKAVARRKENDSALREQKKSRTQIVKALGREYVDDHSRA